jgi:uroporphyrin-III C-methyltransferase
MGTTSARKLSNDVALAAIISNCCYFDGHEQVRSDCSFVPKESKGETPVAIIQNGTTAAEK